MSKKGAKDHSKTAWVKIEWEPDIYIEGKGRVGGYVASSSVNPRVQVVADTRHRALSAIERDMPRYLQWERGLEKKRLEREKVS